MLRLKLVLVALGLGLPSMGCCLCASPYDYCGPTYTGECGEPCLVNERMGSNLSGPMVTHALYEGEAPTDGEPSPADEQQDENQSNDQGENVEPDSYYDLEEDAETEPPAPSGRTTSKPSARRRF
jgi:hypothetical protein